MRRPLVLLTVAATAAAAVAVPALAATKSVKVGDNYFVTIQRGPDRSPSRRTTR